MDLFSNEAEQNVIEALMTNKTELLDTIKIDYFWDKRNRQLVQAIMDLHSKNIGIDFATITNQLKNNNSDVPRELIVNIIGNIYPINVDGNIKVLEELYKHRETIRICQKVIEKVKDPNTNIDSINTELGTKIDKLIYEGDAADDDCTIDSIKRLELDLTGITDDRDRMYYGIPNLDKLTRGLHKGELTTIAAQSGIGKTALAIQVAGNQINNGERVLMISREMDDTQIYKRLFTNRTEIDGDKFRQKNFTKEEWQKIKRYMDDLRKTANFYVNTKASTITEIKKRIRKIKPSFVIIDYLQLLTPEKSEASREREVAMISREIKGMTLDFNIPILCLSQINNSFGDSRPKGERAIRESSAVYQNSDNVIYIHRPSDKEIERLITKGEISYSQFEDIEDQGNDLVELLLDKQRSGQTGSFLQMYVKNTLTFAPIDLEVNNLIEFKNKEVAQ